MIGFGFLLFVCIFAIGYGLIKALIKKCRGEQPEQPALPEEQPPVPIPVPNHVDLDRRWKSAMEDIYSTLLAKLKMDKEGKLSFDLTDCAICQESFQ